MGGTAQIQFIELDFINTNSGPFEAVNELNRRLTGGPDHLAVPYSEAACGCHTTEDCQTCIETSPGEWDCREPAFCLTTPRKRPIGVPCTADVQCESGMCEGVCVPPCGDGVCDPILEECGVNLLASCTVDCGLCANGSVCFTNDDCGSGICNFGICIAGKLAAGVPCSTSAACRSGTCTGGLCIQSCGDGFCDGTEKCGNSNSGLECTRDCGKCGNGSICTSNSDCASNACNFGFCVSGDSGSGHPCSTDNACRSKNCFLGFCT